MEHLRLALRIVIGQACKTVAAFQDIRLALFLTHHHSLLFGFGTHYPPIYINGKIDKKIRPVSTSFEYFGVSYVQYLSGWAVQHLKT
jgi:hypothetical protein